MVQRLNRRHVNLCNWHNLNNTNTTPTPTQHQHNTNPNTNTHTHQTPTPSTVSNFGNSAIGTYKDQNDQNAQSISYFKATTTGPITDIIAYISGATTGKATAALYAVNGNTPNTLLAQSNSVKHWHNLLMDRLPTNNPNHCNCRNNLRTRNNGQRPSKHRIVTGTGQRTGGPGDKSYTKGFTNPFGTTWFNDLTGAMSIYATSTTSSTPTQTPTPTPTTTPTPTPTTPIPAPTLPTSSSTNLAPLPSFSVSSGSYSVNGNPTYIKYPVTVNGQTAIEMLRNPATAVCSSSDDRELNGQWIDINPGDRIVFTAWFITTASSQGDTSNVHGGCLDIDMYGGNNPNGVNRICGIMASDGTDNYYTNGIPSPTTCVPWGTGTWTQVTMDFVVPSTYAADGYSGSGGYAAGTPVVPSGFIPVIYGGSNSWIGGSPENGIIYVSNTEIYVISP